jgi:hypothetical protein
VLFVAWGEGKQEVPVKNFIMLIAVRDEMAASANNSNLEITFYSDKCG